MAGFDPQAMASRIKTRRRELGLSLQDIADRAGCTKSHVWEIEKGRSTNPTISMALALSDALQISLGTLIGIDTLQPNFSDDELRLVAAHREIFKERA